MASIDIPLTMTEAGPVPTPPATLRQTLLTNVAAEEPGYTVLPGGLIEDISSTDTGALSMIDQARVDAVNAIAIIANPYLTVQLGEQLGIPQGTPTNGSVDVVFSSPTMGAGAAVGYVIAAGWIVSDGSHQYVTQEGTIIGAGGSSAAVTAIATQSGSWAIAENSVDEIITSVPSSYSISVTNPQAGTPAQGAETLEGYQARVLQGQKAAGIGTIQYLYTLIQAVAGVDPRLVNVLQKASGWEIIVGGGDVYAVANAIFLGLTDISRLVGSDTPDRNVSVTIIQPPNTYDIPYVDPPQQTITATVTWNTTLPNFTAGAQVNSLAAPALVEYINTIRQGQPINLLDMAAVFQIAVASVLPIPNLTSLVFTVYINAVETAPNAGTSIIPGDAESYFEAAANAFTVMQG